MIFTVFKSEDLLKLELQVLLTPSPKVATPGEDLVLSKISVKKDVVYLFVLSLLLFCFVCF